jgi:aspartate racemase
MKKAVVGVLGGMGPEATVDFMSSVIRLSAAEKDQDHIRMIVDHNPCVPDRQAAMRGDRSAVNKALTEMALGLEAAGAEFLVMPCNTAHVFIGDVLPKLRIPFLHIVDETVHEATGQMPGAMQVGILATSACVDSGIYQQALAAAGRSAVLPDANRQHDLMELIFRIKHGDKGADVREAMRNIAAELVGHGAEIVVAGCTEIPLVLAAGDLDVLLVSSTEVLAERTVALANNPDFPARS